MSKLYRTRPEEARATEEATGFTEIRLDVRGIETHMDNEGGQLVLVVPVRPFDSMRIVHALDDGQLTRNRRELDELSDELLETLYRVTARQWIASRINT